MLVQHSKLQELVPWIRNDVATRQFTFTGSLAFLEELSCFLEVIVVVVPARQSCVTDGPMRHGKGVSGPFTASSFKLWSPMRIGIAPCDLATASSASMLGPLHYASSNVSGKLPNVRL